MSSETTATSITNSEMDTASDESLKIIRAVVLLFLLAMSLIGNSLVIFAIAVSSKRSQNPFNAYLLSMAAFGVLECTLTISFATGFSLEGMWLFGDFLKGFNACFVQLQNIGVLLTVTAMTVDRYTAVTNQLKYRKESSVHRANYAVLYTWIHAFLISLPLLFHNENLGLKVREYVERSLCGLSETTTIIYTIILIGTSYAVPFILAIVFFIIVSVKSASEKKHMKTSNTAQFASYCMQESQLLLEARRTRYVLLLFVLYFIFKLPYVSVDVLTQFNVEGSYVPLNTSTNNTSSVVGLPDANTFYYQTAIMWMMLCFSAMFPLVTIMWFSEHRKRLKIHCCCEKEITSNSKANARRRGHKRQPNANGVSKNNVKTKLYVRSQSNNNNKRLKNKKLNNMKKGGPPTTISSIGNSLEKISKDAANGNGFRVPVLYAAADGLHLLASDKRSTQSVSSKQNALAPSASSHRRTKSDKTDQTSEAASNNTTDSGKTLASSIPGQNTTTTAEQSKPLKSWLTLNPGELLKRLKKNNTAIAENLKNGDDNVVEATFERPSSVVDKRVDVQASSTNLQPEEESYFRYACSDFDDDTESELNESANSSTLILPRRHVATAPARKQRRGRSAAISPLPLIKPSKLGYTSAPQQEERCQSVISESSRSVQELFLVEQTPRLPHTPSPPPEYNEYFISSIKQGSNAASRQAADDSASLVSVESCSSFRERSSTSHSQSRRHSNTSLIGERIFVTRKTQNNNTEPRLHTPVEGSKRSLSQNSVRPLSVIEVAEKQIFSESHSDSESEQPLATVIPRIKESSLRGISPDPRFVLPNHSSLKHQQKLS